MVGEYGHRRRVTLRATLSELVSDMRMWQHLFRKVKVLNE